MKINIPITLTDAMLSSCTIAEPASSETAWVSGGTYAIGDKRIRAATHRVYKCVQAHTGRTTAPELDSEYWLDYAPTLRWAAFDGLVSTPSTNTASMTYVLTPGMFNAICLLGLDGYTIAVTVKDAPDGSVIYSYNAVLEEPAFDLYDWAFGRIRQQTKLILSGITPYLTAEVTITIASTAGVSVGVGMISIGDLISLINDDVTEAAGLQYDSTAEPVSNSYIKINDDGEAEIVRRQAATNAKLSILMPRSNTDYAVSLVQSVLDVPCLWVATDDPYHKSQIIFGLGSGSFRYANASQTILDLSIRGLI